LILIHSPQRQQLLFHGISAGYDFQGFLDQFYQVLLQ
jgi:hypothetical protein